MTQRRAGATPVQRRCFVDGQFVDGGTPHEIIHPANGSIYGTAFAADETMVDQAVAAAQEAMHGEWHSIGETRRCQLLRAVADGIERRFDDFLEAEIMDTGKPKTTAQSIDIPRGAANFRVFADMISSYATETFQTESPDGRGALNYALRGPLGPIAVICPWNLPLLLMTWKVAPALACGNTVIVKPSEETPSTATLLAEVMSEVGIPDGVYNVVHGPGPGGAGEFLARNPRIAAVTFTGASKTGAQIQRMVADGVKPVSFELGGKNAAIVFEDANLDVAIPVLARSIFANTGQVCLSPERFFVARSIFDEVVAGLKEQAEELVLGHPHDESTTLGPMISAAQRDKVLSYYEVAKREGAEIVTGGGVPKFDDDRDNGFFIEPTIWTGLAPESKVNSEEIFGPACHLMPIDTEDEAIALANDTQYGLAATIWTENLVRAHRVAAALEVGITWVNCWFLRDLRTPFGGTKLSGIGREGGMHSLRFYSELRNVCIKL